MPQWDPEADRANAEQIRARTISAMRGPGMSTVIAGLLRESYRQNVENGIPADQVLTDMYACFGKFPDRGDSEFQRLGSSVSLSEIARLQESGIAVMHPRAISDLAEMMRDPSDDPIPVKFRPESGFLYLPQPIFARESTGAIRPVRAFVWTPERLPSSKSSGITGTAGVRITVYDDMYALNPDDAEDPAIPPLLFRRADFLDKRATWQEVIAARTNPGPVVRLPSHIETLPEGAIVFDDPHGTLHFQLLRAYVERSREKDVVYRKSRSQGRSQSRGRSGRRRGETAYVPPRTVITEPPAADETAATEAVTVAAAEELVAEASDMGTEFHPRGEVLKRPFVRRTAAWPVSPVVRQVVNPETGVLEERVVRKGYTLGPRKDAFTYEELAADKANGVQHPMPGVTHAMRARPKKGRKPPS